ncbi:MAG: hypothetical protein Q8L88_06320 [Bacteroidota bacterium]|nr:hypothetical protein [Bacteroidota bacterium]
MSFFKKFYRIIPPLILFSNFLISDSDSLKSSATIVYVNFHVNRIYNIDSKNQSFDCDFYLWMKWKGEHSPSNYEFLDRKEIEKIYENIEVDTAGFSYLSAHFRATFINPLDVSQYPQDEHKLFIRMENFDWTEEHLAYKFDSSVTNTIEKTNSAEWNISILPPKIYTNAFLGEKFSRFELDFEI